MAYTSTCLVIIHFLLVVLLQCSLILSERGQEDAPFKPLVEGFVYCQSSNLHTGEETLAGSTPLEVEGATVSLVCMLDKTLVVETTATKYKGYFSILPQKSLSHADLENCKVYLQSSPDEKCSIQTDLNGGVSGAKLQLTQDKGTTPLLQKFTVGPFAFRSLATLVNTRGLMSPAVNPPCDPQCSTCHPPCCYCSGYPPSTCFC